MENTSTDSLTGKIRAKFDQWFGLPSGKPPDVEAEHARERNTPHGTLTSADAKDLPPHGGTGLSVE